MNGVHTLNWNVHIPSWRLSFCESLKWSSVCSLTLSLTLYSFRPFSLFLCLGNLIIPVVLVHNIWTICERFLVHHSTDQDVTSDIYSRLYRFKHSSSNTGKWYASFCPFSELSKHTWSWFELPFSERFVPIPAEGNLGECMINDPVDAITQHQQHQMSIHEQQDCQNVQDGWKSRKLGWWCLRLTFIMPREAYTTLSHHLYSLKLWLSLSSTHACGMNEWVNVTHTNCFDFSPAAFLNIVTQFFNVTIIEICQVSTHSYRCNWSNRAVS